SFLQPLQLSKVLRCQKVRETQLSDYFLTTISKPIELSIVDIYEQSISIGGMIPTRRTVVEFVYFCSAPLQFGLKNNLLAAIDILLVLGTLIWALLALWHASPGLRWVVFANIPYLLWVTFATGLQLTITYLNR
ncbi:MAG: CrtK protein, membrane protein-like protein, partial [Candidatus Moranbacteria bacterium GW2011_GWF2_44_10]